MKLTAIKKLIFLLSCLLLLQSIFKNAAAQKLIYSSENVFIDHPDKLQLASNIGGNHHLLSFIEKENPLIFVFDNELNFQARIVLPFKFPEKTEVRIIPFENFYYLYTHTLFTTKYSFWKIDRNGNFTELSTALQSILRSQLNNIKLGFQLIAVQKQLWMVYHTSITDLEKNTVVVVKTDSLLNIVFTHKVVYDFKREEERLSQEVLMFGKYLLVLKIARSATSLELMKVNLATGYTIRNTFYSSGYFYSQASLNYNYLDSTITVSALLSEPKPGFTSKRLVFISRLNKILIEEAPFKVLKSQFIKNTGTNFLLIDGGSKWMRIKPEREQSYYTIAETPITVYQDLSMPDANNQIREDNNRLIAKTLPAKNNSYSDDQAPAIRFSLLDKNFNIINERHVPNAKNSYTIKGEQFTRFKANNKEYMLAGQRFFKRMNGLLLVVPNDKNELDFTNIRVNDRYDYLLQHAQSTPDNGIIIPYTNRREAGLIKLTIE